MTIAVWSVKGGVGVTSVAAMLAIAQIERAEPTVLVDLCGDLLASVTPMRGAGGLERRREPSVSRAAEGKVGLAR